jgi:hypothetical protein
MARTDLNTDDKFELLLNALLARQEQSGLTKEDLQELLASQATAMQRALKPENATAPMHSCMAYPEGDTARPRENILTKQVFLRGFPLHKFPEASTWWELELAEQVRPGSYRVIKKDMTDMRVDVTGEYDPNDKLTKIDITFHVSREDKDNIPAVPVLLSQLVPGVDPMTAFLDSMQKHLEMMVAQKRVA